MLCLVKLVLGFMFLYPVKGENVKYLENLMSENQNDYKNYKLPLDNSDLLQTDGTITDYGEFDFIIVGAGTAGSTLAGKLSKIKKWKILLLEAGGDANDFSDIPAVSMYLYNSEMNWGYYTMPQTTACLGMKNFQCNYPRGKVLGGSGTINGLVYTRGNKEDYDEWEKMGNKNWGSKNVMPYFMELEKWQTYGDLKYHGFNGRFNCNITLPDSNKFKYIQNALHEKKLDKVDYNGKTQLGYSRQIVNVDFNKRVSLAKAYLTNPSSNLNISKHSYVTKLILDDKKVKGVNFVKNNITYRAYAKKEVILSAGSINTPQILILSGIGPEEELKKHGIKVVKNLPVGQNLEDHANFIGTYISTNISEPKLSLKEELQRYLNGAKPLTAALPGETIAFIQVHKKNNTSPDLELLIEPSKSYDEVMQFGFNTDSKVNNFNINSSEKNAICAYIVLLHPQSRGSVTLKSKDPKDFPNVNLNLLSDKNEVDINILYLGFKFIEDLLETPSMKKINATLQKPENICQEHKMSSKKYWFCVIRHMSIAMFHPVGTTRMGQEEKTSVVSSDLKVHGIKNLRIVDAGVMPKIISGHTNAPTAMIALKIGDEIIDEYK